MFLTYFLINNIHIYCDISIISDRTPVSHCNLFAMPIVEKSINQLTFVLAVCYNCTFNAYLYSVKCICLDRVFSGFLTQITVIKEPLKLVNL